MLKRLMNLSLKYRGARSLRHLYVITASLYSSNCFTGSQFNWRSKGVTWSNLLEFVTLLLAKFWIDWSSLMFPADIFDHTVEQYNILLKTNNAIGNFKISLLKLFLKRFI